MIGSHLNILIEGQCRPFSLRQTKANCTTGYLMMRSHSEHIMIIWPCGYFDVSTTNDKTSVFISILIHVKQLHHVSA